MSTTISAVSIGQAAALIQAMPNKIREAAEALEIRPAMRINLVDHYSEDDLERIATYLRAEKS
jgi:hypothetical protein